VGGRRCGGRVGGVLADGKVKKGEEMRRLLWCLREEGRGRLYGCGQGRI